ncbi:GDSL lipase/esterase [Gilbertella persicaria]|uniref:GDSL lipase/esterase n=1 Tax=Gilbertella persicaria TaxID=101096 RepID=UPI00222106E1|nr:GDSL lipase/esterase [Gilbertella persicaria]KAI8084135.1 GDSL lipase/esterase [Gilbertella persicaria]
MRLLSQVLVLAACQTLFATAQPIEKRATKFTSLFAFGDSYTDNRSLDDFYQSGSTHVSKESAQLAGASYLGRAADRALWVENLVLDKYTGADLYDFARAGATANNKLIYRNIPDMDTQVNTFKKSDVASKSKSNAIHFLWIGVNDINLLWGKYQDDTSERRQTLDGIVNTIKNDLDIVKNAGAKNIVLMGLIPLQEVPMYYKSYYNDSSREKLKQLILSYNSKLKTLTEEFASKNKGTKILFFDSYVQFYKMFDSSTIANNRFVNCNKAKNCDNYIWWDELHPSGATHKKISETVYNKITEAGW